jgi:hypothetical protein
VRWSAGQATVERLLAAGHVERVQGAQADGASWLEEVIRAQFGPALRAFGGLRRRRKELEYPLYPTEQATTAEAAETLGTAAEIIDAAAKLVPNLGFF